MKGYKGSDSYKTASVISYNAFISRKKITKPENKKASLVYDKVTLFSKPRGCLAFIWGRYLRRSAVKMRW